MGDHGDGTVEGLKKLFIQANQKIVRKEEQVRKLTEQLDKLRLEKKSKNERKKKKKKEGAQGQVIGGVGGAAAGGGGGANPKDPVFIFPEEVWEKILEKITDSKDLHSCSKTCTLFQTLVAPRKTTWMFEKVFPHLYLHQKFWDMLNCRLVCKNWASGIDSFFENHRSVRPQDSNSNSDPERPYLINIMRYRRQGGNFVFGNSQMYQAISLVVFFEELMKDHPRNPFVGRAVTISEYADAEAEITGQDFWRRVHTFLKRFGKHIWYLTFNLFEPRPDNFSKYYHLEFAAKEVHNYCPELRSLRICGNVGRYPKMGKMQLDAYPWPDVHHLETLQLDDAIYDEPNLLVTTLLTMYKINTLKRLHLKAKSLEHVYNNQTTGDYANDDKWWERLTELHVEELSTAEHFDALLSKMRLPQLRKLGLSVATTKEWTFAKLLEVLNELSKNSPLHTLRLAGRFPMDVKSLQNLESSLFSPPTLKTLELEHSGDDLESLSDYTFLLRFPYLEKLNLFWRAGRDWNYEMEMKCRSDVKFREMCPERAYNKFLEDGGKEAVDILKIIYGGQWSDDVYKSNIWEVMPRLKILSFQALVYTREGYEYAKRTNNYSIPKGKYELELDASVRRNIARRQQQASLAGQPPPNGQPSDGGVFVVVQPDGGLGMMAPQPQPDPPRNGNGAIRNIALANLPNGDRLGQAQAGAVPPRNPQPPAPPPPEQSAAMRLCEARIRQIQHASGWVEPDPVLIAAPSGSPQAGPSPQQLPQPSQSQQQPPTGSGGPKRANPFDCPTKPVVQCPRDQDPLSLHELVDILHGPPNPQMKRRAMELLRSNPELMASFTRFMGQQDQQRGPPQPPPPKSRKKSSK